MRSSKTVVNPAVGLTERLTDALGDTEADGDAETLGDKEGLALTPVDGLGLGDMLADGDCDREGYALLLNDGETLNDGE